MVNLFRVCSEGQKLKYKVMQGVLVAGCVLGVLWLVWGVVCGLHTLRGLIAIETNHLRAVSDVLKLREQVVAEGDRVALLNLVDLLAVNHEVLWHLQVRQGVAKGFTLGLLKVQLGAEDCIELMFNELQISAVMEAVKLKENK